MSLVNMIKVNIIQIQMVSILILNSRYVEIILMYL